jgi:phosphohistidine phosphatase
MNLCLLRHAIAAEASMNVADHDRSLTKEGIAKLRRVVRGMRAMGLSFDCILSSPLLRARQTAEIVAKAVLAKGEVKVTNQLAPNGRHEALLRELARLAPASGEVLLVGHEPQLSRLISLLVTGSTDCSFTMKKAGLCLVRMETVRPGHGTLEWLLTPKQLSLMRGGSRS